MKKIVASALAAGLLTVGFVGAEATTATAAPAAHSVKADNYGAQEAKAEKTVDKINELFKDEKKIGEKKYENLLEKLKDARDGGFISQKKFKNLKKKLKSLKK